MDPLSLLVGIVIGFLVAAVAAAFSEDIFEPVWALIAVPVAALSPFWLQAHMSSKTSATWMNDRAGNRMSVCRGAEPWLLVFDGAERRVRFSPVLLVPNGLVKLAVRLFGRRVELAYHNDATKGSVFSGLRVAPGLTLARRRPEDVRYCQVEGRYPTADFTAA